jgi:hypothetical protein
VDKKIELAEPNFITLAQEEAADALHLLAVLIRAAHAQPAASTFSRPRVSPSPEDLADGSPSAPQDGGKVALEEAAGGGP